MLRAPPPKHLPATERAASRALGERHAARGRRPTSAAPHRLERLDQPRAPRSSAARASAEPRFSCRRALDDAPGLGRMSGERCGSHANATCVRVAPASFATRPTRARHDPFPHNEGDDDWFGSSLRLVCCTGGSCRNGHLSGLRGCGQARSRAARARRIRLRPPANPPRRASPPP